MSDAGVAANTDAVHPGRRAFVLSARAAVASIAVICGLAAALVVLAATRQGAGATPDTGHYLATADSLLQGHGFVRNGPEIMASWPPLYPAVLATFGLLGIDMLTGARVLNAVALAICAAACVRWLAGRTRSLAWAAWGGIAVVSSPPLVYAATLALSDAPFIALQALALWRLDLWLERPQRSTLIGCVVLIALACLMRYNGVVLIATAVLAALTLSNMNLAGRLRHAVVIGAAAGAPLGVWILRNLWLTGTAAGPRVASEYSLLGASADAGYTVMSWFTPYRVLTSSRWAGLLLLLGLLCGLAALACRGRRTAAGRTVAVCLTFLVLFLSFMILTFARVSVDPLADRMLAPVYVPLVVAAVAAVAAVVGGFRAGLARSTRFAAAAAAILVTAVLASRTGGIVRDSRENGAGGTAHSNFNTAAWRSSPTLRWAGQHLRDDLVFASAPAALYIATGARSRPMPRKHARRSPGVPHDRLPALRAEVAARGEAYLVVSSRHVPSHAFSLDELAAAFLIERVRTFSDGTVYRLTPRAEF